MAGASVLELPAAGAAAGGARRCRRRWLLLLQRSPVWLSASGPVEDRDAAVAVGRLGGGSVHRALQTANTVGQSPGHVPDHRRLRPSTSPIRRSHITCFT